MTVRVRTGVLAAGVAGLLVLLVWGIGGLPHYGAGRTAYARYLLQHEVRQRHATNVVSAVVFDYRGFDTVGEEFILFAAVIGVTLLLRQQRDETERPPRGEAGTDAADDTSDAVRVTALGLVAPSILLGLYTVAHGQLTPGGGFQGGGAMVAAPLLVYVAGRFVMLRSIHPMHALDAAEGSGAGGFVLIGLVGLVSGSAYLANVVGKGRVGSVFSGGTLPIINLSVALAVVAGLTLVLYELLEQTLLRRRT